LPEEPGLTLPAPFSVIVTLVALPPNVLPLTVTGDVPQVLPEVLLRWSVGPFTQPHSIWNDDPVVTQPAAFLTDIV
jgi:hypothetical protein